MLSPPCDAVTSQEPAPVMWTVLPERVQLQVDGGVNHSNVREAREAGANLFVAATAVFGDGRPADDYRGLVDALT